MSFKFENLRVWQSALELSVSIDSLTRSFPPDERFVLSSQIKRAADSVALNIAEGSTGQSDKEFARFLGIANRSAIEVVACLHIGKSRAIISNGDFMRLYIQVETLVVSIQSLRKSILKS